MTIIPARRTLGKGAPWRVLPERAFALSPDSPGYDNEIEKSGKFAE